MSTLWAVSADDIQAGEVRCFTARMLGMFCHGRPKTSQIVGLSAGEVQEHGIDNMSSACSIDRCLPRLFRTHRQMELAAERSLTTTYKLLSVERSVRRS